VREVGERRVPDLRDHLEQRAPRVARVEKRLRLGLGDVAIRSHEAARELVEGTELGICRRITGARRCHRVLVRALRVLDVPLRERNQLLLAAGYAPSYRETGLAATLGTPQDAMLQEIRLESFFPADDTTAAFSWSESRP
jgi:hypothetical protein